MQTLTICFNKETVNISSPDGSIYRLLDDASHIVELYHEYKKTATGVELERFHANTITVFSNLFKAVNTIRSDKQNIVIAELVKTALVLELAGYDVKVNYQ